MSKRVDRAFIASQEATARAILHGGNMHLADRGQLFESEDAVAQADYSRRLERTRAKIAEAGLDGLLMTSQYNRRYLTGFTAHDTDITESSGWVLVTPQTFGLVSGTFQLIGMEQEYAPSGVKVLLTDETLPWDMVAATAKSDGLRRLGFEKEWMSYDSYDRVRKALAAQTELAPSEDLVELVRAQKDEAEIATMRRAAEVADEAFVRLTQQIRRSMSERQIAAMLEDLMVELGASGTSFPTIVAAGPGAAQPHAVPTDREVQPGEPLLIDFGCRVDGYCSDITRTICIGEPDPKLVEIYGIVYAAQEAALAKLQAGARRGRDVDAVAREVIANAGYGDKFIHSLGHGVGLAVHEMPVLSRLRSNTPEADAELTKLEQLGNGSVVSNEPGIYLSDWGGVRLEDTVVVTELGADVLTKRNPPQIRSIEG
ncbi:MAG TPA: Xaa-Pro peptidase family protein [Ktedonobacterales bacterium]|jgi:Xaa-Pro aminopeptidase|nr:Xaa-Pro peptidase family protein [Ktedonobacterales bacterium]